MPCTCRLQFLIYLFRYEIQYTPQFVCDNEGEKMGMNNLKPWLIQVLGAVRRYGGYLIQKFGCMPFRFFQLSRKTVRPTIKVC